MKRINTNPVEALDKKRPTLTQKAQEAHDGMFTDSINVVHIQHGLDNADTDNMQMEVPEEQESIGHINNDEGDGTNVLSSDTERGMHCNSRPVGEDAFILKTHAEGPGSENERLEGLPSTDIRSNGEDQKEEMHKSKLPLNNVRSKKLKTDREDPVNKIRNRNKYRTKNIYI